MCECTMRANTRCLTTWPHLYHTFPEAYVVNTLTSRLMCRDLLMWHSSSLSIHTVHDSLLQWLCQALPTSTRDDQKHTQTFVGIVIP